LRLRTLILVVSVQLGLLMLGTFASHAVTSFSLVSSAVLLESVAGFEALASDLNKKGAKAHAPASIVGKSGVKHEFAFALMPDATKAKVVVDTELSVKDVDEMKVLKFYVKVFDVNSEKAILCVSPKLNERASTLAREYGISVLEDEVPKKLIAKAAEAVNEMMSSGAQ
jgi:hypothetical protein